MTTVRIPLDRIEQLEQLHAIGLERYADKLEQAIGADAWRRSVRPNTIDELARDLRRAGVHATAIYGATRRSDMPPKPWAPHVTRAEIEADAEHIKRWGYV